MPTREEIFKQERLKRYRQMKNIRKCIAFVINYKFPHSFYLKDFSCYLRNIEELETLNSLYSYECMYSIDSWERLSNLINSHLVKTGFFVKQKEKKLIRYDRLKPFLPTAQEIMEFKELFNKVKGRA